MAASHGGRGRNVLTGDSEREREPNQQLGHRSPSPSQAPSRLPAVPLRLMERTVVMVSSVHPSKHHIHRPLIAHLAQVSPPVSQNSIQNKLYKLWPFS